MLLQGHKVRAKRPQADRLKVVVYAKKQINRKSMIHRSSEELVNVRNRGCIADVSRLYRGCHLSPRPKLHEGEVGETMPKFVRSMGFAGGSPITQVR